MSRRAAGRARRRRLWFGLLTVLGLARRGFFIPHRYAGSLPPAGTRTPYPAVEALFADLRPRFREVLGWIDAAAPGLTRIEATAAPPAPRWGQTWFPRLDAALAYTLVRRFAPRRIVEVGAGHSTRFLARAVADAGLSTRMTAIDPAPRADLADPPLELPLDLRRVTVQDAGLEIFTELAAGDLLSIDSSHILMPGSDVDFLFGRVFPDLAKGVLVQIHDIFLPDDYPGPWDWRGYNEQLGVLPLLTQGGWEPIFASRYVATRMADALESSLVGRLPIAAEALESSLWLRVR